MKNNRRLVSLILVFIVALAIYCLRFWLPGLYFNIGKDAYNNKDYPKAYQALNFAVKMRGNDRDYRYYYVQTLLNLTPNLDVQRELFKIAQVNLSDSADMIADRQLSIWKNRINMMSGENYIEKVPYQGQILRWDVKKFPLLVCVQNQSPNNLPEYYTEAIKNAFLQWQQSSSNLIKFKFVENPNDAQILVKIVSSAETNKCDKEGCKYVVANTSPVVSGETLKKMEIDFYDLNNLNQPYTRRQVYNTMLHEIGHSLGIMGHSSNKTDLMYMESNLNQDYDSLRSDFQLISSNDLNTLKLLYKLVPDITNTPISQFDTYGQYFAPIVLGNENEVASRKLVEAENYVKAAPNLPNGYLDMAAAYVDQKEYNKAVDSLNEALFYSTRDEEKYVVYYNLAVVYMNVKDWDNVIKFANIAKNIKSSSDIDGMIAFATYNKGDSEQAKVLYNQSLNNDPTNIVSSINLARIYIKEFNLAEAGKVLNRLVATNPEAKADSRIRAYGLLMFIFK